jgi:hypothetical protein
MQLNGELNVLKQTALPTFIFIDLQQFFPSLAEPTTAPTEAPAIMY